MIVVADTGPINYLVLIGHIDLVQKLYGALIIPPAVHRELLHPSAPPMVRAWALNLPRWADVRLPSVGSRFAELGPGEREAIALALELATKFILLDEILGRRIALQQGIVVKGTLGVLEEAASLQLIDLPEAIRRLRETNIFLAEAVVQQVLGRHKQR